MSQISHHKDHLILPYASLMRFVDEKNTIHVLNLNDVNNISVDKRYPRSYHRETDYYNPEYDDEVKDRETLLGKLNAKLSKAIDEIEGDVDQLSVSFDTNILKNQIIDIATVEFHRLAIVDDEKLKQYCKLQQERNDEVDKKLIAKGALTKERAEYSTNYRKTAASLESFRYYAQNILGSKNDAIIYAYKEFEPFVLYVPSNANYSFWLPPFHFIGNECFLVFVISPRIALALYPPKEGLIGLNVKHSIFVEANKNKVDGINSRVFESIGLMPNGFKELIGTESDMEAMKSFIDQVRIHTQVDKISVMLSGLKDFIKDDLSEFRTEITLNLLCGNTDKTVDLVIETDVFNKEFLNADKNGSIAAGFKKYGFDLRVESVE